MSFSVTINGVTKTLADWQINNVQLRRVSLAPDQLAFSLPRQRWDEPTLCAFGDAATLLDATGAVLFQGTRLLVPQQTRGTSQSQRYTFAGPLFWLTQNVYQQPWYNGTRYTSHIIANGSIGHTVKRVLDYAIANGAQIAYVAAELTALNAFPPVAEFTEKLCLDLILDTLQFAPDIVSWLDYSTATPEGALPTLHFRRRQVLEAMSVREPTYFSDAGLVAVSVGNITPLPTRQLPSAKINWERFDEIDGKQFLVPFTDIHPPTATGREDGAFNATVTIQGRKETNVFGEIETEAINTGSIPWWKKHFSKLQDPRRTILTGPSEVTRRATDGSALAATYPNELLPGAGQIAPWMDVNWQTERVTCKFSTQIISEGDTVRIDDDEEFSVDIITCDAPVGVSQYQSLASSESGDPVILGLAEFIYDALNPLQYDAQFTLKEQACSCRIGPGKVLNLVGSSAEYEAMRALVQEATYNLDNGTTEIICGPSPVLGINQLLGLLQRFRARRTYTNPDTQDTGEIADDGSQVTLGKAMGNTNSVPGDGVPSLVVVKDGGLKITQDATNKKFLIDFGDGKKVTIDAAAVDWLAGKELKVKEYGVCVKVNNVDTAKKALFIATDHYD